MAVYRSAGGREIKSTKIPRDPIKYLVSRWIYSRGYVNAWFPSPHRHRFVVDSGGRERRSERKTVRGLPVYTVYVDSVRGQMAVAKVMVANAAIAYRAPHRETDADARTGLPVFLCASAAAAAFSVRTYIQDSLS